MTQNSFLCIFGGGRVFKLLLYNVISTESLTSIQTPAFLLAPFRRNALVEIMRASMTIPNDALSIYQSE